MSEVQATGIEEKLPSSSKQSDDINLVKGDKRRHSGHSQRGPRSQSHPHSQPGLPSQRNPQSPMTCRKCGKNWPHKQGPCPAKGRTCSKCGKPNHFAKMCLTPANRKQGIGQQRVINLNQKVTQAVATKNTFTQQAKTNQRSLLWISKSTMLRSRW